MTTATTATVAMSTVLKTRSGGRLRVLITVLLLNLAVTRRRAEGLEGANSWYKDRHSSKGRAPNHHTRCLISCGVGSVAWFTSRDRLSRRHNRKTVNPITVASRAERLGDRAHLSFWMRL